MLNFMFKSLEKYFEKRKTQKRKNKILKDCGNVCYCNCGEPLNDEADCLVVGDAIYNYYCKKCGANSVFHFGIAPVPIKLDDYGINEEYQERLNNNGMNIQGQL